MPEEDDYWTREKKKLLGLEDTTEPVPEVVDEPVAKDQYKDTLAQLEKCRAENISLKSEKKVLIEYCKDVQTVCEGYLDSQIKSLSEKSDNAEESEGENNG
jgi:hypothetical protein